VKYILIAIEIILILFLFFGMSLASDANAAVCRQISDRNFCIVSIKRSAKNYWEYRVAVSVDGVKRPIEVYNCRDRSIVKHDKTIDTFKPDNAGEFICTMFQK
jgi:hypothetical protein